VGGERVSAGTLRRAHDVLGDERLPYRALLPAYGLAGAVLAVSMPPVERGPRVVRLDREALADGLAVESDAGSAGGELIELVSAGPALPGNVISAGIGRVEEIRVRSPSLAEGYVGSPDVPHERFSDGLQTGDLGFLLDGELFISGRIDELLCIAGRNVYATDIEAAIEGGAD